MSTIPIRVDQVLFLTYAPAVAMVLMLWDHFLMLGEEVAIMWSPRNESVVTKVVHVLNRYVQEAVLIYRISVLSALARSESTVSELTRSCKAMWLATTSTALIASITQFYIMMRAYRLWDHRETVRRTFLVVFGICITAVAVLAVLSIWTYLKAGVESQNFCFIERVPKTITYEIGILLAFSVFVILITIYNVLEEPRRSENSLLDSLRRNSAWIYFVVCVLWLLLLVFSVTIEASLFFALFILVLSLNANIATRVHLRVESLRLLFHRRPVMIYQGYIEG